MKGKDANAPITIFEFVFAMKSAETYVEQFGGDDDDESKKVTKTPLMVRGPKCSTYTGSTYRDGGVWGEEALRNVHTQWVG